MKALAAPAAVLVVLLGPLWGTCGTAPAVADPAPDPGTGVASPQYSRSSPPFVDHTEWTRWGRQNLSSLRVFPTPSARAASRRPWTTTTANEAWAEVLALSPDANTPGMRAQFLCHWQFAETAQPGKTSWNLEPWRPVVDDAQMLASGCNPGAPEEAF
jgi:hypothetical protein